LRGEVGCILRTFAHDVRDGLIPNMFPAGRKQGLYPTADATLWFFHAIDRYLFSVSLRHPVLDPAPSIQPSGPGHGRSAGPGRARGWTDGPAARRSWGR